MAFFACEGFTNSRELTARQDRGPGCLPPQMSFSPWEGPNPSLPPRKKVQKSCQSPVMDLGRVQQQAHSPWHEAGTTPTPARVQASGLRGGDARWSHVSNELFRFFPQGGGEKRGDGFSRVSETALQSRDGRQRQARLDLPHFRCVLGAVPGSATRVRGVPPSKLSRGGGSSYVYTDGASSTPFVLLRSSHSFLLPLEGRQAASRELQRAQG